MINPRVHPVFASGTAWPPLWLWGRSTFVCQDLTSAHQTWDLGLSDPRERDADQEIPSLHPCFLSGENPLPTLELLAEESQWHEQQENQAGRGLELPELGEGQWVGAGWS